MREILVLSGKGGVGKSSLTASIGSLLSHKYKLVLADTDVDAPNLHIVLGAEQTSKEEIKASDKAFINYDLCSSCMTCIDTCQFSSIIGNDEPVMVSYSCEGCGACTITCPENAIEIKPVVNGSLNYFDSSNIKVVAGKLDIGESSSGRLVDVVKRKAKETAESYQVDLMLTDGPPGIGCPVIASLKGADYVLLVTEPTPTALHDLRRVVKVVEYFKTSIGIVINKADMHKQTREAILQFVRKNGFDLLAEIPYDRMLPLALSEGKPVVNAYPDTPASLAIKNLSGKINDTIWES